jgi:hypothetical protein
MNRSPALLWPSEEMAGAGETNLAEVGGDGLLQPVAIDLNAAMKD